MGLFWVESGKRERESASESDLGAKREKGRERREKIYLNNEIESYSNYVNIHLHGYCSILVYAEYYRPTGLSSFFSKNM